MAAAGVAVLAWVLGSSLSISATSREASGAEIPADRLAAITEGEVAEFVIFGTPLFVLRPSSRQLQALADMDSHVWNSRWSGYDEGHGLFIYWGVSTRFPEVPCKLQHIPPGPSPLGEGTGYRWLGGYLDPCHDSSYDYAGRTIKSLPYTRVRFNAEVPNLRAPEYQFRRDGTLVVSMPAAG
jgi:hypothetical protein